MNTIQKINQLKWEDLEKTGSVRLYENEGYDLNPILNNLMVEMDSDQYAIGLLETRQNELCIEILKYDNLL